MLPLVGPSGAWRAALRQPEGWEELPRRAGGGAAEQRTPRCCTQDEAPAARQPGALPLSSLTWITSLITLTTSRPSAASAMRFRMSSACCWSASGFRSRSLTALLALSAMAVRTLLGPGRGVAPRGLGAAFR